MAYPFFSITINHSVISIEDDDDDDDDEDEAFVEGIGQVKVIRKLEKWQRIITVIIPVNGGWIVVRVFIIRNKKDFRVEVHKTRVGRKESIKDKQILIRTMSKHGELLIEERVTQIFNHQLTFIPRGSKKVQEFPLKVMGLLQATNPREDIDELNVAFNSININ